MGDWVVYKLSCFMTKEWADAIAPMPSLARAGTAAEKQNIPDFDFDTLTAVVQNKKVAALKTEDSGWEHGAAVDLASALQMAARHTDWDPNETGWAKLLAQLVSKEKSGGCTAQEKFGIKEAPDWWSEALAVWANQPTYGKAFKKPARDRKGQENTNAGNYKAPRRAAGRQGRASSIEQFFLMFRCEF